jgi:cadmium resistance protein CadD (predicted permease)
LGAAVIETAVLAIAAFASTNIDDVFVLLAFFSDPKFKAHHIVIGQFLGIAALTAGAFVTSYCALAIPVRYIGFMGALPILIGVRRFWMSWTHRGIDDERGPEVQAGSAVTSVVLVTLANGGDNIAVYVPLFARQAPVQAVVTCIIFFFLTGVWCLAGKLLVSHPLAGKPIRRWGHWVVPFALVAIGAYILVKGDVPQLVASWARRSSILSP